MLNQSTIESPDKCPDASGLLSGCCRYRVRINPDSLSGYAGICTYDQFCKFVASAYKSLDERTVEKATAIREALYKMVNADNIHPTRDQVIAVLGDYFNCIGDEANNQLEYYLSLEEKIASKIVD